MSASPDLWFGFTDTQKEGINLMLAKQFIEYEREVIEPRHKDTTARQDKILSINGEQNSRLVRIEAKLEHQDKEDQKSSSSTALVVTSVINSLLLIVAIIALFMHR
jgi:hypothetical protein